MISTMLVDLDHLLANPMYVPHPMQYPIPSTTRATHDRHARNLMFCPKLRLVGIGLIVHTNLDSADCFMTNGAGMSLMRGSVETVRQRRSQPVVGLTYFIYAPHHANNPATALYGRFDEHSSSVCSFLSRV